MSVKSFNFRARARTIEHLGKGQIADSPTAVSELWKNAYDAYARDVALYTIDSEYPCGALIDNGCGMSPEQIVDNWLIVGTESKSKKKVLPEEDRFGINIRQTQGEKGIGRLSAAFLANVTFLVTKKLNGSFTSLLVDWRLFENPYLAFEDISIPYLEFDSIDEVQIAFNLLKEELIQNVQFEKIEANEKIIRKRAWDRFSEDELENNSSEPIITTQNQILNFCLNAVLDEKAINPWKEILDKVVEKDGGQHGTALFILDLRRDLRLLTNQGDLARDNQELENISKELVDTLRAFTNPYIEKDESFSYRIFRVRPNKPDKPILEENDVFKNTDFEILEHTVVGIFNEKGWFKGRVKAFGEDKGEINIPPNISINPKSGVGSFKFHVGTYESTKYMSSLEDDEVDK
ncbi:ATP-binding protein [Acinetobacter baumannii]|nr:ATP-binding protein [Acinetobacter baumannii]